MEEWRDIPGYEGLYSVSSIGRVKILPRIGYHPKNRWGKPHKFIVNERLMSINIDRYGYTYVGLITPLKRRKHHTIHRLVSLSFLPGTFFDGATVNHIDGNRKNNCVENLEWVTIQDNLTHAKFFGGLSPEKRRERVSGIRNPNNKLSVGKVLEIKKLLSMGAPQKYIAEKYDVSQTCVSNINIGKTWGVL